MYGSSWLELSSPFFFQAEGVIRGLVRARGLGDVYKGQASGTERAATCRRRARRGAGGCAAAGARPRRAAPPRAARARPSGPERARRRPAGGGGWLF